MASCVFPGSFDPVTKGHLDLIKRASEIFDHVTVTLMVNIHKTGSIPVKNRIELLEKACSPFLNVSVDRWDGLLADYMHINHVRFVIRGLRSAAELEYEMNTSAANRLLNNQVETVFLPADPSLSGISSSAVREIASFGGDISAFIPSGLTEEITKLLSKTKSNNCL